MHVGAAWTADSQRIAFSTFSGITWIDRTTGDTGKAPLDSLKADVIIAWPVDLTADDTIVFRAGLAEDDEQSEGVRQVELDGSGLTHLVIASDIAPSRLPAPMGVGSDGHYLVIVSVEDVRRMGSENMFYIVDVEAGDTAHLEINGSRYLIGPPVFALDARDALVHGGETPKVMLVVLDLETGVSYPVAGAEATPHLSWFLRSPTWADNTVFIPGDSGGDILALESLS